MQPNSSRGTDMSGSSPQLPLHDLQTSDHSPHDDFLDQMLSTFPSWPDLSSNPSFDESALLASRLRHHQISSKSMGLHINPQHNQLLVSSGLAPLPLSLANTDSSSEGVEGLYNGFAGSLQTFAHPQGGGTQSFGAPAVGMGQTQSASAATAGGTAPPRQRVRARRGQATDPHSIAERLRRERIAERMKSLQELVPNANKTDKASMLDEIIDYVKFLQLQVKVLSMSRLGGAAAVASRVGDLSSEGSGGRGNGAAGSGGNDGLTVTEHQVAKLMEEDMGSAMQYLQGKGLCLMPISLASAISTATGHPRTPTATPNNNSGTLMHHQHSHVAHSNNVDGSTSPNMSVLTVQSAALANIDNDASRPAKDSTSISKP